VAVLADAEEPQVNAAGGHDLLLVGFALQRGELHLAIEHVRVPRTDVDLLEEVLVHEVAVALVVIAIKAPVLVEVEG
jgi:hypothetical protein